MAFVALRGTSTYMLQPLTTMLQLTFPLSFAPPNSANSELGDVRLPRKIALRLGLERRTTVFKHRSLNCSCKVSPFLTLLAG
jgi:hypothetical protein|eukprot:COSAG01_NODE_2993_length_6743_cov_9.073299_9_plen_82_part_00